MAKRTFYSGSLTDVGFDPNTLSKLVPTILKLVPNNVRYVGLVQPLEIAMDIRNRKDDHVVFVKLTLHGLFSCGITAWDANLEYNYGFLWTICLEKTNMCVVEVRVIQKVHHSLENIVSSETIMTKTWNREWMNKKKVHIKKITLLATPTQLSWSCFCNLFLCRSSAARFPP